MVRRGISAEPENLHLKHLKEVAETVERVAREENIQTILVAADEVALPHLKTLFSRDVRERLIELSNLDMLASDADVIRETIDAFRRADVVTDRDLVAEVLNAFRARGLGTIGVPRVRAALTLGQVDHLLVPAIPSGTAADEASVDVEASVARDERSRLNEATVEQLVTMARQTDAAVTFIEDASLLKPAGGVAAILRFRLR